MLPVYNIARSYSTRTLPRENNERNFDFEVEVWRLRAQLLLKKYAIENMDEQQKNRLKF